MLSVAVILSGLLSENQPKRFRNINVCIHADMRQNTAEILFIKMQTSTENLLQQRWSSY